MALHHHLAKLASESKLQSLSAEGLQALKATVFDTIGCALGAAKDDFAADVIASSLECYGYGTCSVIGRSEKLSPAGASFVNATLAHGYDFDDVHLASLAHFSAIVIPAALAACEQWGSSGTEFLEAVMFGDEVGGRIGLAGNVEMSLNSTIRARGFFPTAILGTIAAAAAVAKLARLGEEQIAQSIAIAASYSAGLACVSRGDNTTKRTQAGWAAQSGYCAAILASKNFTGPDSVLETNQGFFEAFTGGKFNASFITRAAGEPWICQDMSFKLYPIEYIIHPLVELCTKAKADRSFSLATVDRIEASATKRFKTLFLPRELKANPHSRFHALMSAPYCIALALNKAGDGHLSILDFREDYRFDKDIQALAEKVVFTESCEFEAGLKVGGSLRFYVDDVCVWAGQIPDVYGNLDRPISKSDLVHKFHQNCSIFDNGNSRLVLDDIEALPNIRDAEWVAGICQIERDH